MNSSKKVLLAGPLVALLLLAGCGGQASDGSMSGSTAGGSAADGTAATPEPQKAEGTSAGRSAGAAQDAVATLSRSVISKGAITVRSKDVAAARGEVMGLVTSWGGMVADEQTESDRKGRVTDSTMTLRVPSTRFDLAMTGLARVGDVLHQSRTSEDVTTQVIDNRVRVRAAQRSIETIEGLLRRATKLSDVISIESDLARRQANLDSLEQQQAYLSDQTSLSTIAVHLSRTAPPETTKKAEARGFLAGLDHGWTAFRSATVTTFTVIGALLPFALLALVVGVPLWVVVRRRRPMAGPATEGS